MLSFNLVLRLGGGHDGKIYLTGENGNVLDNSATYGELARSGMGESILATPAIADGRMVIRTRTQLYCVSKVQH